MLNNPISSKTIKSKQTFVANLIKTKIELMKKKCLEYIDEWTAN